MIYCLMVSGTPLTEAMRNHLFTVARQMVVHGHTKRRFTTDDFEGCVYTQGQQAALGMFSGVHFTAVIESDRISTRTSFIVPTGELADLDQSKWYDLFPHWDDGPSLN